MVFDAPSSAKGGCPASPEYQALIDFAARNSYSPEKLGDLDQLKNKYNCAIQTPEDAVYKAAQALSEADPAISAYPKVKLDSHPRQAGIGSALTSGVDGHVLSRIVSGGPADVAGLKVGDKITAIDGIKTDTMDGHHAVFNRLVAKPYDQPFGGLGAGLKLDNGILMVNDVPEGSAAEAMGLKSGDLILSINGKRTLGESLADTNKILQGPEGSQVSMTIERDSGRLGLVGSRMKEQYPPVAVEVERDGQKFESTVSRRHVQYPTVTSKIEGEVIPGGQVLPDGAAYIKVDNFLSMDLAQRISEVLDNKRADDTRVGDGKALVLDLRNNFGGVLTDTVLVSSLFASYGDVYRLNSRVDSDPSSPKYVDEKHSIGAGRTIKSVTVDGDQNTHTRIEDASTSLYSPDNLVVLVNENTVGAAEILAESLRVNAGARIIGNRTYGNGNIFVANAPNDYLWLQVPSTRLFTSTGDWLGTKNRNVRGIVPDIQVDGSTKDLGSNDDKQLSAAFEWINRK